VFRKVQILILFALIFSFSAQNSSHAASSYDDKVNRLMELTRAVEVAQQMIPAMMKNISPLLKQALPELPDQTHQFMLDQYSAEFTAAVPAFMQKTAQLYKKYFTEQEISELLDFYETPTGRKFGRSMPAFTKDAQALGVIWGQQVGPAIGQKVMQRVRDKGLPMK